MDTHLLIKIIHMSSVAVLLVVCIARAFTLFVGTQNNQPNPKGRIAFVALQHLAFSLIVISGIILLVMNDFKVTYLSDTMYNHTKEFNINYTRLDKQGNAVESFDIQPYILYTNDFSKLVSTNPSTKHYLTKDIFSIVSNLPKEEVEPEAAKQKEDSLRYQLYQIGLNDTVVTDKNIITVAGIVKNPELKHFDL